MKRELYHYGILGQKWGVRRYQNEDGTLTEAGRARYNSDGTRKKAKDMSLKELQEANNRLQAEAQYKENIRKDVSSGQRIAVSLLATAGSVAVATTVRQRNTGNGLSMADSILLATSLYSISELAKALGGGVNGQGGGGGDGKKKK